MRKDAFQSFEQFRNEVLGNRAGPGASSVDELVEELYHGQLHEEFESLWDGPDSE